MNPNKLQNRPRVLTGLALGLASLLVLGACDRGNDSDKERRRTVPAASVPPPPIAATEGPPLPAPPTQPNGVPVKSQKAVVTEHVTGDTFGVEIKDPGGVVPPGRHQVHLFGLNAPSPRPPEDCFGKESADFAMKEAPVGANLTLFAEGIAQDVPGTTQAFVWKDNGEFFNEKVLRDGFARINPAAPKSPYTDVLVKAEAAAREATRGLWNCRVPAPNAMPPAPPTNPLPPAPPTNPLPPAPPAANMGGPGPHPDGAKCNPFYPAKGVCIAYAPPELNCGDVPHRNFAIHPAGDPHGFDTEGGRAKNNRGCE